MPSKLMQMNQGCILEAPVIVTDEGAFTGTEGINYFEVILKGDGNVSDMRLSTSPSSPYRV